ncbi:MAG TPA: hypothetical protein VGM90_40985 [Kofleriaceae bacterium]|jgi:hypothetical protein
MRLMYGIVLLLVGAAAACGDDGDGGSSPTDAIAASDSGGGGDAFPNTPSLRVDWDARPQLGSVSTTLSVSKAQVHADRLQVISDVEDPTQTTARNLDLVWLDTGLVPDSVRFDDAPPALYSKIKVSLDEDQTATRGSVRIEGKVDAGMGMRDFTIETFRPTSIEVSGYSTSVFPGGTAKMGIDLDVAAALAHVDWANLNHPASTYVLDDTQTTAMDAFLVDLDAAFLRTP